MTMPILRGGAVSLTSPIPDDHGIALSPPVSEETVWKSAMLLTAQQAWSQPGMVELYALSDWLRRTRRGVERVRRDPSSSVDALAWAEQQEKLAKTVEAELDSIYEGPIVLDSELEEDTE